MLKIPAELNSEQLLWHIGILYLRNQQERKLISGDAGRIKCLIYVALSDLLYLDFCLTREIVLLFERESLCTSLR